MSSCKVLMIAPLYFGYEKYIYQELKSRGCEVTVLYENLQESKILYRYLYSRKREKYYSKMYKYVLNNSQANDEYSYIFVIRGSGVSVQLIEELKKRYPKASTIMYQWDSVKNNPNALNIEKYFDRILTFDLEDAEQYNWIYRPLFYIEKYDGRKKTIDLCYLCSLHSNRAKILADLKIFSENNKLMLYHHLFVKKIVYYRNKYFRNIDEYVNSIDKDVKFTSLSIEQSIDLYCKSKCVVDYTHPGQAGFTMRTVEAIGASCKLITNNQLIRKSDIYKYGNVFVYNEDSFDIPLSFVNSEYKELPKNIYYNYSLEKWIDDVFGWEE